MSYHICLTSFTISDHDHSKNSTMHSKSMQIADKTLLGESLDREIRPWKWSGLSFWSQASMIICQSWTKCFSMSWCQFSNFWGQKRGNDECVCSPFRVKPFYLQKQKKNKFVMFESAYVSRYLLSITSIDLAFLCCEKDKALAL